MKKVFLLILPLLLAIIVFVGITIFINSASGKGALQVTSIPKSHVYLNGNFIGDSPLCKCDLPQMLQEGNYTIKLIPVEGNFSTFEQKITLNKATLTAVDRTFGEGATSYGSVVNLSSLDDKKEAEVLVISFPDKANIFLDTNLQGTSPMLLKNLTASDHELSITKDGYKDKSLKISTSLGYKLTALVFLGVNPSLISSPSGKVEEAPIVQKIIILNTPTGFLRIRESNSLASAQVGEVYPGDTFDLIDEKEDWFEIKFNSPTGEEKSGWVNSLYARKQ